MLHELLASWLWLVMIRCKSKLCASCRPIIITRADAADAEARPKDLDREFITLFQVTLLHPASETCCKPVLVRTMFADSRSILGEWLRTVHAATTGLIVRGPCAAPHLVDAQCADERACFCLQVLDESNSPYTAANQKRYGGKTGQGNLGDDDFGESCKKHTINGAQSPACFDMIPAYVTNTHLPTCKSNLLGPHLSVCILQGFCGATWSD